jgi:hypothetical protein
MTTYIEYTDWKTLKGYYLYGYLREEADEYGGKGTMYYVGLGQKKRAISSHLGAVPSNKSNIVIFSQKLTKIEAELGEIQLIQHYGRISNKTGILRNISKGGETGLAGTVLVRDQNGDIVRVDNTDPRYLSGKYQHVCKNLITVKDKDGNTLSVSTQDSRYTSGELVSIQTGTVVVKDAEGRTFKVNKADERYLSGELVYVHKSTVVVKDGEGNIFRVSEDDPRYLSGELVGRAKDKVNVKDKHGNMFSISKYDERFINEELVGINAGKTWKLSKPREQVKCPHCDKVGDTPNMKRWHYDNCTTLKV